MTDRRHRFVSLGLKHEITNLLIYPSSRYVLHVGLAQGMDGPLFGAGVIGVSLGWLKHRSEKIYAKAVSEILAHGVACAEFCYAAAYNDLGSSPHGLSSYWLY